MQTVNAVMDKVKEFLNHEDPTTEQHWFVLDRELTGPGDDDFSQGSVVDALEQFIKDYPDAPYSIAIYGRWGQGKSTVARLLLNRLKADSRYWVVDQPISLWHYPPEELPRVINARLVADRDDAPTVQQPNVRTTFNEVVHGPELKKRWTRELFLLPAALIPLVVSAVSLMIVYWPVAYIGYFITKGSLTQIPMPSRWGLIEVLSKLAWGPVTLALVSYIFARFKAVEVTRTLDPMNRPSEFVEDFKNHTQGKRPVVVLDDLDRLSAPKMIKALEAAKAYLSHQRAIFIIPCDDDVLRKNVESVKHLDEPDGAHFLDKFFQYSIRLPIYRRRQMKEYALSIWEKVHHPFLDQQSPHYLPPAVIDEALDILIHAGIQTPRQVKRVLNEFTTGYVLCVERERIGMIAPGGLTRSSIPLLAKLAVLRAEFPDFYQAICGDHTLLRSMNRALSQDGQEQEASELQAISPYLSGTDYAVAAPEGGRSGDDRTNTELVRFLLMTRHIKDEGLRPFLHFRNDDLGMRIRSAHEEGLEQEIQSGNVRALRTAALNARDNGRALMAFVLEVIEDSPPGLRLARALEVGVACMDLFGDDEVGLRKLATSVTSRYNEAQPTVFHGLAANLLGVLAFASDLITRTKIIKDHLSWAREGSRSASEVKPWAAALFNHAGLLATDGLLLESRPVFDQINTEELLPIVNGVAFTGDHMALLGGAFFRAVAEAIVAGEQDPAWTDSLSVMMDQCYALFPDDFVDGVSGLLTANDPGIRTYGISAVTRKLEDLARPHLRDIVRHSMEAAVGWKDPSAVVQWITLMRSIADRDPGVLDSEAQSALAQALASGFKQQVPETVKTAITLTLDLASLLDQNAQHIVFSALIRETGETTGDQGRTKALANGVAVLLPSMSQEDRTALAGSIDNLTAALSDIGRSQAGAEVLEALINTSEGREFVLPQLTKYLNAVCNTSFPWNTKMPFGLSVVRALRAAGGQTLSDGIRTLANGTLNHPNDNGHWKLGVRLLLELQSDLANSDLAYTSVYNRYSQWNDYEFRAWSLDVMGRTIGRRDGGAQSQWNAWFIEILRQQPLALQQTLVTAAASIASTTFVEALRDPRLWPAAQDAWRERGQVRPADALISDLEANSSHPHFAELVSVWRDVLPSAKQENLAKASLAKVLEVDAPSRTLWLGVAAEFRQGAAQPTITGQANIIVRLWALPAGEVLDSLDLLMTAYPEVPKEERAVIEGALTGFVERSKTERELRAARAFVKRTFGRMPSSIKQTMVKVARRLHKEASYDERKALGILLSELDAVRGNGAE